MIVGARGGPTRPVARLLAALLVLFVAGDALAQVQRSGPGSGTAAGERRVHISAQFGWDGFAPSERFAPIWITIDPGSRAIEGTVSLIVPQDAVQGVRLVAPFAAAAGRATTIEFAASMPPSMSRAEVQVQDRTGRVIASQVWTNAPAGRQQMLPAGLFMYEDVIACVGTDGLPLAAKSWTSGLMPVPIRQNNYYSTPQQEEPGDLFEHVVATSVQPAQLPTAWIAYDSLRCLVVSADSTRLISPMAAQAIRDWVIDGGRLVVLADQPGAEWMAWLTDAGLVDPLALAGATDAGEPPVEVRELTPVAVPVGVASVIGEAPRTEDSQQPAVVTTRMSVRPIVITPRGTSLGWRSHWTIDSEGEQSASILAEGPLGLGFVTIVGFDPADAVLGVDRAAVGHLWKHVLAGAMEPFSAHANGRENTPGWWGQQASGDTEHARQAMRMGLDHLADVRVPSGSTFYLIAGACLGLALLIGPVDAVVLKRLRLRPLAWATALAWIGVASITSYVIPAIGESDGGRLGRLNIVDQVHNQDGLAVLSRQTALTGVFSARAGRATIAIQDPTAWWRGVSSVQTYYYGGSPRSTALPITVAVGDVAKQPAGAMGPTALGATVRAGSPRTIPMGMYTFRTLMERGAGRLPIAVQVSREADDSWHVGVAGMPEGSQIMEAELAVGSERFALDFTINQTSGHHAAVALPEADLGGRASAWRVERLPSNTAHYGYGVPGQTAQRAALMPGQMLRVMGASDRTDPIDRLVASGKWALVSLVIDGVEIDATTNIAESSRRTVVARLLVPLEGALRITRRPSRWEPRAADLGTRGTAAEAETAAETPESDAAPTTAPIAQPETPSSEEPQSDPDSPAASAETPMHSSIRGQLTLVVARSEDASTRWFPRVPCRRPVTPC